MSYSIDVIDWVKANGYSSLDEWMADSDYIRVGAGWMDEDGNDVDPFTQATVAMEASTMDDPCPTDNSHLPVDIGQGEKVWYNTSPGYDGFKKTYGPLWDRIDNALGEGHSVKRLTFVEMMWGATGRFEVECTCGGPFPDHYRQPASHIASFTTTPYTAPGRGDLSTLVKHGQARLVAPVHVYTARSARVVYKGYVAQGKDQFESLVPPGKQRYRFTPDEDNFLCIQTSSYKNARPKFWYGGSSLDATLVQVEQEGHEYIKKGLEVEFTGEAAAVRSSDQVADLIIALQRAGESGELGMIKQALEVTDEYVRNADLLREMREKLAQKFECQFDLTEVES